MTVINRYLILAAFAVYALIASLPWAQSQIAMNPIASVAICVYDSSPPTGTSGTFIYVQCNSSGQLVLH